MDAVVYDKIGKEAEKVREVLYGIYPQETITGADIASFDDGADDIPVKALTVGVEPVQDLHGYDHPWPGGGGKNLLKTPYSDTSKTSGGITATVNDDGSVTFVGTATADFYWSFRRSTDALVLPTGTYMASINDIPAACAVYFTSSIYLNKSNLTRQITVSDNSGLACYILIPTNAGAVNFTLKLQIEAGTTATTWTPYSNICPISGWTGAKVTRTGKNLLDISSANFGFLNATNGEVYDNNNWNVSDFIPAKSGQITLTWESSSSLMQATVCIYDKNKQFISGIGFSGGAYTHTFDIPTVASYFKISWSITVNGTSANRSNIRVNLGNTDLGYTLFTGSNQITITFPTEAGTVYGGTLDAVTGLLTVDRTMLTLNTANMNNSEEAPGWRNAGISAIIGSGVNEELTGQQLNIGTKYSANTVNSNDILYLRPATYGKTQSEWQALAMDIQVCARLANPVTFQLAPQEITTLLGANNIWADTGAVKKLAYRADLGKYISSKINEASANILNA